ncbi:dapper homolog 2 [Osmerus mordax]|uniref:dapper homolog 2 n=1 Tax=Osmerus mordax TaxID=8014 RepID=UPI0035103805
MLSSKVSGPGLMSAAAGIDRGRVGERLQAALAGLHELHYLKEKQSDMVSWALRMDREEPACSPQTHRDDPMPGPEEQRLEATLTALKQQLSRLRRQDVGLKTHLQELDQQISELKLDVCMVSSAPLESDSRPSSGFYELSDGGSCSLSNSCTSVYSECLSSSSHTSLLPPPSHIARPHPLSSSTQAEPSRRRSADETTTQPNPPRGTGLHLGSSRIRTGTASSERARQRPVSTGDLDRMLIPGLSYYRLTDVKKPSLCPTLRTSTVEPKFQNNLVSRSGAEVYCYPSPLHAVALQSPIFTLGGEPATTAAPEGQEPPVVAMPSTDSLQRGREVVMNRPLGYIDKLLQRSMNKINFQSETGRESVCRHSPPDDPSEASADGAICPGNSQVLGRPLQNAVLSDVTSCDRKRQTGMYPNQEVSYSNPAQRQRVQENSYRYSYPAAMREYSPAEAIASKTGIKAPSGDAKERASLDQGCVEAPGRKVCELRASDRRSCVAHWSCTEEGYGSEYSPGHAALSPDFVHAQFVPAGSQCVKLRPADRKTKAVKLRRRERPWAGRRQRGCYSSEGSREGHRGGAQVEREQRRAGKGRMSQRVASCLVEELGRTGTKACLSEPGLSNNRRVYPHQYPQSISANKLTRGCRAQCLDLVQPSEPRKRRQGPANMGMFQAMCVQGQRSRELVSRSSLSCNFSSRPHSGHWGGHTPRALQPSLSSSSYFTSLNGRYPPVPFPVSAPFPPRCESEYSTECASLFHSTIAESSEGEVSDNTINRFGDSESSQSSQSPDSDSSMFLDEVEQMDGYEEEGGLVWAEASLGPTAAGLPLRQLLHPEPPACRIKASRALKKKIRRFQPASLKVMTLV